MYDFFTFLLTKVYKSKPIPEHLFQKALENTYKDIEYHFPELEKSEIDKRIATNSNELAILLFRIGNELHTNNLDDLKWQIHWLLKELCCCEIYFNNQIEEGFYVVHGEGTVIGSRNKIGKGFKIHQGCTIGHKRNGVGDGCVIGNDVTLYCNSSILGDLHIGDNVVIGAHVLVISNVYANNVVITKAENLIKEIKLC